MLVVPLTPDGARTVTIDTTVNLLTFRSYYSYGQESSWLLDVIDANGQTILAGLKLTPGSDNILKGQGDLLEGYQLYVLLLDGTATAIDAPGNNLQLILYLPGEENFYKPQDPMLMIGKRYLV